VEEFEFSKGGRDVQAEELDIVTYMLKIFRSVPQESRRRIIETVCRFFDLRLDNIARAPLASGVRIDSPSEEAAVSAPTFSEDRSIAPKQFMFQKQPRTDVEKVACLAYYLTHYRDSPHFKTLDISKLNTEAAQAKLSNPAVAVDNATKQRYLVPATKGNKQLSAIGEQFVLALPDRDRAREVMSQARPHRRSRKDSSES
jgi:hypothetical protein